MIEKNDVTKNDVFRLPCRNDFCFFLPRQEVKRRGKMILNSEELTSRLRIMNPRSED